MATWQQFLGTLGTTVNVFGIQCVALANYYHRDVLGIPLPSGFWSAHEWWTKFSGQPNLYNNYDRIPMSAGRPQVGDIVVEYPSRYNGEHGHVCVVVRSWNGTNFETYDQNYIGLYVSRHTKNGSNAYGMLRPKGNVSRAFPAPEEEVLTPEQKRMLNEIHDAIRSGSNSIQTRLNAVKSSTSSILATVSEMVVRSDATRTQKDDRAMTQDFLNQVLALLDEIDAGFTSVGYDNIAEPAQINYYQSEADPGESSVQNAVRDELDKTKLIK